MLTKARQRAALVAPHQAGVADNVCGQDRRQFALLTGHGSFPRSLQRIVEGLALWDNQLVGRVAPSCLDIAEPCVVTAERIYCRRLTAGRAGAAGASLPPLTEPLRSTQQADKASLAREQRRLGAILAADVVGDS